MLDPRTFDRAINAARSVVKGSKRTVGVIASVAVLSLTPACADKSEKGSGSGGDTSDAVMQKQDVSVVDDIIADIKQMLDGQSEDSGTGEEVGTTDTGGDDAVDEDAAVVDATIDDAVDEDAAVADAAEEDAAIADAGAACISNCYEPTGVACESSLDCEKYLPGKCDGSDEECTPENKCEDGAECKGSYKVLANMNPETGETAPWSPVTCIDGECHDGGQISQAAQACCTTGWEKLCEGVGVLGGCNPWGPPAPPAFDEAIA